MKPRPLSAATWGRLFAALAGLAILTACGSSFSTTSPPGIPEASVSPSTLTFPGQFDGSSSTAQWVTLSDPGTAILNISSIAVTGDFSQTNTCGTGINGGGECSISVIFTPTATGTRTGTLTITDNASGSPQKVGLTGTGTSVSITPAALTFAGVALNSTSPPMSVTLSNMGTTSLAITSVAIGGTDSSDFALATGANVCPYTGGNVAASGSCNVYVTFTPPTTGTLTATLTVTDNAGGTAGSTQTVALSGSSSGSNSVAVNVNFGLNPFSNAASAYYNNINTSVTVCNPGSTTACVTVQNVLVDTGSTGLRIFASQLSGLTLPQITEGGNNLYECFEFGDLEYTWGPVAMANVQIGGETASGIPTSAGGSANTGIPIQVIADNEEPPTGAPCIENSLGAYTSPYVLGSNGVLGIGNRPQDCGEDCTSSSSTDTSNPYMACTSNGSACNLSTATLLQQAWNPVAAFPADNNGSVLTLPSIGQAGQSTVQGTLTFGIGTETNNGLNGATVYALDDYANFASVTLFGVTYASVDTSGSFIDSGSNAYFVLDAPKLTSLSSQTGVTTVFNCSDNEYYCPSATLNLPLTLAGANGATSPPETISIENADALLNSTNAALNDLGGQSTDSFDLGLPFFYGRSIFVGIADGTTYPNGYWAF